MTISVGSGESYSVYLCVAKDGSNEPDTTDDYVKFLVPEGALNRGWASQDRLKHNANDYHYRKGLGKNAYKIEFTGMATQANDVVVTENLIDKLIYENCQAATASGLYFFCRLGDNAAKDWMEFKGGTNQYLKGFVMRYNSSIQNNGLVQCTITFEQSE
jgi:hypothetical protein